MILRAFGLGVVAVLAAACALPAMAVSADAATVAAGPSGGAASSAAASAGVSSGGVAYVALGDSYAAGYGLGEPTGEPVSGCSQSGLDYPHRVATSLGLDLTDVSCAGATTANVATTSQLGAAPQVDALGARTRVVTVSIGGNDADLFGTASSCIALSPTGPVIGAKSTTTSCSQTLDAGGDDALGHAIDTTVATGLRSAFSAIAHRAPNARVVVVGYPAIFPDPAHTPAAGCFRPVVETDLANALPHNGFPFTSADVRYLAGVQAHLDRVTHAAADRAGFAYVSTLAASEGHSGCATVGSYIEGITLTASSGFTKISLQTGALHPNERGVAFLAARTTAAVRQALASESPAASPAAGGGFSIDLIWLVLAGVLVVFVAIVVLVARRARRAGPAGRGRPRN